MLYTIAPGESYDEIELDGMSRDMLDFVHAKARKTASDYELKIANGTDDYEAGGEGLATWEYKEIKRYLVGCRALYKTIEFILKSREMGRR